MAVRFFNPPRLTLAPLQGLTEAPLRALVGRMGGVDAFVTPFVRISHGPCSVAAIFKQLPEIDPRYAHRAPRQPVSLQLLGSEPGPMARSAEIAAQLGVSGLDLNFGCPDNRVNRHRGGAAVLRSPQLLQQVTRAVREAFPEDRPVSVKVRLGWESVGEVERIVTAAARGGASWITVHGRTRQQRYEGQADWRGIARARKAVDVPVIANGDIVSLDSLEACRRQSGCEHFMIGRGALAVPELFGMLSGRQSEPWSAARRVGFLVEYLRERRGWGMSEGAALGRVKGLAVYLARESPAIRELFRRFKLVRDVQEAEDLLLRWLDGRRIEDDSRLSDDERGSTWPEARFGASS